MGYMSLQRVISQSTANHCRPARSGLVTFLGPRAIPIEDGVSPVIQPFSAVGTRHDSVLLLVQPGCREHPVQS